MVEHDLDTITSAEHIIEIGPAAGVDGGELIFNGAFSAFTQQEDLKKISPTYRAIKQGVGITKPLPRITKPLRFSKRPKENVSWNRWHSP